ncbi:FAD-binding oxidoreductase [Halomonas heilongjiangensis]|uniref:FAD-binding oxidoreductase n=1 Tax=Halomonas heilongjiangensis TaxID=1387883 RepID=A0A2N7TME6_9GAMM|nr:FAD-binding oxidoreductase [Halomonas heilongjiangensis]PMR69363.1 FAD-binding oxidoreductase [Halomonas heilongjiangensis]PXX90632.1 FAD-binding oxidoreductase [Halomonas heilongjiangensis]
MRHPSDLVDILERQLGERGVLRAPADLARYVCDWAGDRLGMPLAVARPASTAEVAEVVRLCHAHGVRMVPQGGHTGLVAGALPDADGGELVISLERLNRIREIDPVNFTMTVDAGCVLDTVKQAAAEHDCDFPLSLGAQGSCQIGGNIATNAGGLNVLRHGMMRQLVLGLEVVLPDGRVWNGLHALHKDNRGYALAQLFLGSEGTLGIVTAAVLRLCPRPDQSRTALLGLPSVEAVVALYGLARRDCSDLLTAFELIPRRCIELAMEATPSLRDPMDAPSPWYVLMEVAATGPVDLGVMIERLLERGLERDLILDGVLAGNEAQAQQLWQFRESMLEGQRRRGEHLRTDISVPISAIPAFVEAASQAVMAASPRCEIIAYGHVGDGNLHFNILPPADMAEADKRPHLHDLEERVFTVLDDFGGSLSAEHGIGRTKQAAYLARLSPLERQLAGGIKALFDPRGLMNPGRILPPR